MGCCSSLIYYTSPNNHEWRDGQNQIKSPQAVPLPDEQALESFNVSLPSSPQSRQNQISSSQVVPFPDELALESFKDPFPGSPQSLSEPSEIVEEPISTHFSTPDHSSAQAIPVLDEQALDEQALDEQALDEQALDEQALDPRPGTPQFQLEPPESAEVLIIVHPGTPDHSSLNIESPGNLPSIIQNDTLEAINPSPPDSIEKIHQNHHQELPETLLSLPATPSSGSIPDAPSYAPSVSVVTSSAATLSWYGSSYDGGSQVTGYNIEAKKLPEDTWITLVKGCHSTSYKTKNLQNGSEYQFRVCAVNVHGVSEPSKPSEPITIQEQVNHKNNNNSIDDYDEKFPPFELKKVSIEPADTFNEEYDLSGELGRGRFGVVYKVKHKKTGQTRAAKVIKCIRATDKQGVRDEIDLMNSLRHPRLLQIAGAYERKRDIVMVLELISGGELFDRVIADDFDLTEKDCIFFMRQICEGLQYMHDNKILHLDLKPENILCVHKNSNHIKLIDFGLSRRFDPEKSMQVLHGTPEFIAPEVINYDPISFTSDMWSVGVICYVLLTGLSPFMGDTDAETLANITNGDYDFDDESFDDITQNAKDFITELLVKKKEDRLTATTCLKHKWLNQKEDSTTKVVLSTDKLKKFTLKRKWQKTGLAIKALGRIASLTSCTSPPVSPIPSNYPPVLSPPSSPLPKTSSASPLPTTPSSPPSLTTVSSPVTPTPVLYTSRTVINLAPVAVNSISEPVKD